MCALIEVLKFEECKKRMGALDDAKWMRVALELGGGDSID